MLYGNYSGTASHAVTALEGIRKQFPSAEVTRCGEQFSAPGSAIPASALSTDDGKAGLKGEYFHDFAGTSQVVRTDAVVDLQLFNPEPHAITAPTGMKIFRAMDGPLRRRNLEVSRARRVR